MDEPHLAAYLQPGERVLWSGQPVETKLFAPADVVLVPFSLLWCGFALFWEGNVVWTTLRSNGRGPPLFFVLWGIPFVLIGLYFVFGRFVVKRMDKRRTYYAVTNQRVLALRELFGRKLAAAFIDTLPGVSISAEKDGVGTVSFDGATPGFWSFDNTGWAVSGWTRGSTGVRFYDVPDARRVYELVNELRAAARSSR